MPEAPVFFCGICGTSLLIFSQSGSCFWQADLLLYEWKISSVRKIQEKKKCNIILIISQINLRPLWYSVILTGCVNMDTAAYSFVNSPICKGKDMVVLLFTVFICIVAW